MCLFFFLATNTIVLFRNDIYCTIAHNCEIVWTEKRVILFVSGTDDQLQDIPIPWNCRSIVLMSIQSFGGGNKLIAEGCHEDGLIEVFFISSLAKMV